MKFEIRIAKMKYDQYNAELFNNELPASNKINFEFFKSKNVIAMIRYPLGMNRMDPVTFRLNSHVDFETEHSLNHTIVHEMVHVCQFYTRTKDLGHGYDFKRISSDIALKSKGLFNITRLHYGEVEMLARHKVVTSNKVEECIIVVTRNNSFRVYKNATFEQVRAQLNMFSCNQEYFRYRGTLFNNYKSSKLGYVRSISFNNNVDNIIEYMLKSGADLLLRKSVF
jgi:hypothetical protein